MYGISVTMPKYGISRSEYSYDKEMNVIAKGLSSIKGLGDKDATQLLDLAHEKKYDRFSDLLLDIRSKTNVNSGKMDTLIHIDFFSRFGNQRELECIVSMCDKFAGRKQLSREEVDGSRFETIVKAHSTDVTKAGKQAKKYTILDETAIIHECEDIINGLKLPDYSLLTKVRYFNDAMGYSGYTTGNEEDLKKLYIKDIFPLKRKKDGKQFGYSVITQSIGSGKEARFTLFNKEYDYMPISKGDIIRLIDWTCDKGIYFTLRSYALLREGDMSEVKELV